MVKLVRDRIPEIITKSGKRATIYSVSGFALEEALRDKLIEEAGELTAATAIESFDKIVEELGDVYEVLLAIAKKHDVRWNEVLRVADDKRVSNGSFSCGFMLEKVE